MKVVLLVLCIFPIIVFGGTPTFTITGTSNTYSTNFDALGTQTINTFSSHPRKNFQFRDLANFV